MRQPIQELIKANHSKQYEEHYWQEYRRLGEKLNERCQIHDAAGIADDDPVLREFMDVWKAYTEGDYEKYSSGAVLEAAKQRLWMYCSITTPTPII